MQLQSLHQIEQLRSDIRLDALRQTEGGRQTQDLVRKLHALADEVKRAANEERILRSLKFDEWKRRFTQVKKAHNFTFEWMFEDSKGALVPSPGFREWLRSGNGIYWICGKAGSGKSTLMKFVNDHSTIQNHLRQWAGPKVEPIMIPWFFWSAGSPVQRSQEGLFRSLLYQILRRYPKLIQTVCSVRWNDESRYDQQSDPWTLDELSDAIDVLSQQDIPEARFCLLIDGLDEYEGLPSDIIRVLKSLARSPSFKLCVSSRPWNEFKEAFGEGRCDGSILLEKFTRHDIERFTKDTLERDDSFTAAEQRDGRYGHFITNVIDRANSVFLWVELVVHRLLKGLGEKNRLDDLQRKLEMMPPTLEKFFQSIFDRIDKADETESARVLLVTIHAVHPLPVVAHHFLEQEEKDPGSAKRALVQPLTPAQRWTLYTDVPNRLNFLCKDLVEIRSVENVASLIDHQVEFLHRTVKDFLMTKDMYQLLLRRATHDDSADWDAHRSLCSVMLARAKSVSLPRDDLNAEYVLANLVDELLFYAHIIEVEQVYTDTELLDEFDQVISSFDKIDKLYRWTDLRGEHEETFNNEHDQNTFLGLAIQSRLGLYVKRKLKTNPDLLRAKIGRPYLDYALRPKIQAFRQWEYPVELANLDLVYTILDKGADPNEKISIYDDTSVWGVFLRYIYKRRYHIDSNTKEIWFQAAELMIRKGADRKLKFKISFEETMMRVTDEEVASSKTTEYKLPVVRDPVSEAEVPVELSALDILKTLFGDSRTAELEAIVSETRDGNPRDGNPRDGNPRDGNPSWARSCFRKYLPFLIMKKSLVF